MNTKEHEHRLQAMLFRWGGPALLLALVIEGFALTTQVRGLEPRMKVLESQLERNCLLFDRMDTKVDEIRNDVTRLAARDELQNGD